ncbi:hypothetical protein CK203_032474 [Vitis vinifera]|uniref:Uncharacterized protein n=1 Tax=Vitis vinifera TaxID=29760 RepID=A0A438I6I6_VITVI|nr:hypothetical protein CK203_032474 [Vitis vinifera]
MDRNGSNLFKGHYAYEIQTAAKWYYCIALAWVDVEANFLGKACCKFPFKLSFQFKFY